MGAFADAVRAACEDFLARAEAMPAAVVEEAAERIIARTPVGAPEIWKKKPPADYRPGHLRSNWNLGIDAIDSTTKDQTNHFYLNGRDRMPAKGFGHTYYISNAMPYAYVIETGLHSRQAPDGMVGITAEEFDNIVEAAAEKVRASPTVGGRER